MSPDIASNYFRGRGWEEDDQILPHYQHFPMWLDAQTRSCCCRQAITQQVDKIHAELLWPSR